MGRSYLKRTTWPKRIGTETRNVVFVRGMKEHNIFLSRGLLLKVYGELFI
jgi:hypothetical protein